MDEALMAAAELIEDHWIRGLGADGKGNYCMLGAIGSITERMAWNDLLDRVVAVLPPCEHPGVSKFTRSVRIAHYNDHHCDGGVEAAKILREAAEVEL
jgi:hypothetical protein